MLVIRTPYSKSNSIWFRQLWTQSMTRMNLSNLCCNRKKMEIKLRIIPWQRSFSLSMTSQTSRSSCRDMVSPRTSWFQPSISSNSSKFSNLLSNRRPRGDCRGSSQRIPEALPLHTIKRLTTPLRSKNFQPWSLAMLDRHKIRQN